MGSRIKHIEYYLPHKRIDNQSLSSELEGFDVGKYEKKIGICARHITSPMETALDMAEKVSRNLIQKYQITQIDYILYCTQSPEYFLPSGACILQSRLKLPTSVGVLDYNHGCSGYIYGLSIAKGLIAGGIAKNILLVTSETYSKYIDHTDKANRGIFGDAATASLICYSEKEHIGDFVLGTDGHGWDKLIVRNGTTAHPSSNATMVEEKKLVGQGDPNHLYMDGPAIFNFTIDTIPSLYFEVLEKNRKESVDFTIFHQANKYMLHHLRRKIGIEKEAFWVHLEETGNTVSNTIPIALVQAQEQQKIKRGDSILLIGFGVGLSWGGTIVEL